MCRAGCCLSCRFSFCGFLCSCLLLRQGSGCFLILLLLDQRIDIILLRRDLCQQGLLYAFLLGDLGFIILDLPMGAFY